MGRPELRPKLRGVGKLRARRCRRARRDDEEGAGEQGEGKDCAGETHAAIIAHGPPDRELFRADGVAPHDVGRLCSRPSLASSDNDSRGFSPLDPRLSD
jgi:hypothetical protein